MDSTNTIQTLVNAVIIIGAGPYGISMAAMLFKLFGVVSIVLERDDCIAPLWQKFTYECLKLRLRNEFYELPDLHFPKHFPLRITKQHLIEYFELYANTFNIKPLFDHRVVSAEFDTSQKFWAVKSETTRHDGTKMLTELKCYNLIVATGMLSQGFMPKVLGIEQFPGEKLHSSLYKNTVQFVGKRVLVVGAGESAFDIYTDLNENNITSSIVVRDEGRRNLLRNSSIKALSGIEKMAGKTVEFEDDPQQDFDSIIFATGYRTDVTSWLKENEMFSKTTGLPNGLKGKHGLYAIGYNDYGIPGIYGDILPVAEDIGEKIKAN